MKTKDTRTQVSYRGYLICYNPIVSSGYWIEKDGHLINRFARSKATAKRIIDRLVDIDALEPFEVRRIMLERLLGIVAYCAFGESDTQFNMLQCVMDTLDIAVGKLLDCCEIAEEVSGARIYPMTADQADALALQLWSSRLEGFPESIGKYLPTLDRIALVELQAS